MFLAICIVLAFLLGGPMASFIDKWPKEIKFFSKRKTPEGKTCLKWFEYIPFFGFIITKGKYSNSEKKSLNEIIIPLLNASLITGCYFLYGEVIGNILFMVFVLLMIVVSWIDFCHFLIPDRIHIGILVIGIAAAIIDGVWSKNFGEVFHVSLGDRFIGLLVGFLPIYLLGIVVSRIKKTEALGGGDIKLLGATGFFIGWQNILFVIVLGAFLAFIIETFLQVIKVKEKGAAFAFGPYLALASVLSFSLAPMILNWYLGLFAV